MRFQLILTALFSLFMVSHCGPEDYLYIKGTIDYFNILADAKDFTGIGKLFLPNATYDPGNGPVKGVDAIEAVLAKILKPGTLTQFVSSTQIIDQLGPFDGIGSPATAKAITYIIVTFFGQGKLEGELRIIYAKYLDELVKTGNFAFFGGWQFASRKFVEFVIFSPSRSF